MSPESQAAWATLQRMARGHRSESSGERAAWEITRNLQEGVPVNFGDCFVRLDGEGKCAVVQLLVDFATSKTGLSKLD